MAVISVWGSPFGTLFSEHFICPWMRRGSVIPPPRLGHPGGYPDEPNYLKILLGARAFPSVMRLFEKKDGLSPLPPSDQCAHVEQRRFHSSARSIPTSWVFVLLKPESIILTDRPAISHGFSRSLIDLDLLQLDEQEIVLNRAHLSETRRSVNCRKWRNLAVVR